MDRSNGRQSQPESQPESRREANLTEARLRDPRLSRAQRVAVLRNGVRQISTGSGSLCPVCGGSGVLRTDGAGHRTCLDCVGKGTLPHLESLVPAPLPQISARRLSASTSGAR